MESIRSYVMREKPWTFYVGLEYINLDKSEFSKKGFNANKIQNKPCEGVTKGYNGEILNENYKVVGKVLIGKGYEGQKWLAHRGVILKVVEHHPNDIDVEYEVSFMPRHDVSLAYKAFETFGRVVAFAESLEDPGGKDAPPPSIHITRKKYVKKKGLLGSGRKLAEIKNIVMIFDVTTNELQQGTRIIVNLKKLHRIYCNESMCEHHVCEPLQGVETTCSVINEINTQKLKESSYLLRVYSQGMIMDEYFREVKISKSIKSPNYDSIKPIKSFLDVLRESIQDADLQSSIDKIWMGIYLAKENYVRAI